MNILCPYEGVYKYKKYNKYTNGIIMNNYATNPLYNIPFYFKPANIKPI